MPKRRLVDVLRQARDQLSSSVAVCSETPDLDAQILLCEVLQCERSFLFAHPEYCLTPSDDKIFQALIQRRLRGEPIAYITGQCAFWDMTLRVTPDVLIPRADTEVLVQAALDHIPQMAPSTVLDLGTGSGAIACAIARERKYAQVTAVDNSRAALAVAQANIQQLGLSTVQCQLSHWFSALAAQQFDVIVSNPPYIDAHDTEVAASVRAFEPDSALFAAQQGLSDLATIIRESVCHLHQDGWLMVEHGWRQGASVRNFFQQSNFHKISTLKDFSGRQRVTLGQVC